MRQRSLLAQTLYSTSLACCFVLMLVTDASAQPADRSPGAQPPISRDARDVQRRVTKVYGAGGIQSLEAYQSGFLVSPEGHIATAWSYVLDVEPVVILDDGRRFESEIIGIEPTLGIAVLKIEASDLPFFKLDEDQEVRWGDPIVAVSNLFGIAAGDESASVMQGTVAAVTNLKARRGTFKTPYQGEVLILDLIANNPGAAGGAVADASGRLIGMLGKELRDDATGVWLNYALPISALKKTIGDIVAGRTTTVPKDDTPKLKREQAHSLASLGLILVPNILEKTPVYVDAVKPESPAAKASLRPDDLILLVDGQRVADQRGLLELLRKIDRRDAVSLTIQRDTEVLPVRLQP